MTHSGMLYRLDISVLFSWAIPVLDFHPLEIYKNLGLLFSTITFTVNSHTDFFILTVKHSSDFF